MAAESEEPGTSLPESQGQRQSAAHRGSGSTCLALAFAAPSQILVTDVLAEYAAERGPKIASRRVLGCALTALTPFWQDRTVADMTPQVCERYAEWRGRSENTVRRELNVLATATNWAFKNGRITRAVAVALPPKPPGKMRWFTRKEVALVLRTALRCAKVRLYLPLFILLATYTGRRKEAILSLRWAQIDLDAGLIDFEGTVRRSNKRRGQIPIPDRLLPHLRGLGGAGPISATCCTSTASASATSRRD